MTSDNHVPHSLLPKIFSRLVAHLLPITYFLVTISFFLKTYDSAQIKITLTQIGCSLVILFWVIQKILEKKWPFNKKDLPLLAPFLAFLISGIISFFQSSFLLGSVDEFIRRVLYSFMGMIVILEFRGWDRHRRLFRWLLAAFFLTVFYGFIQYFDTRLFPSGHGIGFDPFLWRQAFGLRPFSTFGNPNFYGNFLVIITPIILAIYFKSGGNIIRPYVMLAALVGFVFFMDELAISPFGAITGANRIWFQVGLISFGLIIVFFTWWKVSSAAASGMSLFWAALFINLYATETKGAWLGFLGALTATTVLVAFFILKNNRFRKVLLSFISVVVLLGLTVVGFYAHKRFQSVSFRVFTWIGTWEMIRDQPILGTGIGSFKWAYPAYRRPEIIVIESKSNTETDHAEDEYLEVWFDEGILGFGIFLWLILTVSVMGVRALWRLTRIKARDDNLPNLKKPVPLDDRVYNLIAYLGAYWGALLHWSVDVSIRFVSSGIYSLLLPGLVASFIRNEKMESCQDEPLPMDRWIRVFIALFWAVVFYVIQLDTVHVFLGSLFIWGVSELLEINLAPKVSSPLVSKEKPNFLRSLSNELKSISVLKLLSILIFCYGWGYGFVVFRRFFIGDMTHNRAIFFSREGIWNRSSEFDSRIEKFPPEIKKSYQQIGGALEHYEKVTELNPFFPMARYFIGNVYNDWGSKIFNEAIKYKQRGDNVQAEESKNRAEDIWEKALSSYKKLKKFAPNYVQTHHQVGLAYLKMGEMARQWGDSSQHKDYWDLALKNFTLYNQLDPVFPENYYRKAHIYASRKEYAKAEKEYLGALTYNMNNVVKRIKHNRNAETYTNLGHMWLIQLNEKHGNQGRSFYPKDAVEYQTAKEYFSLALKEARLHGLKSLTIRSLKNLARFLIQGNEHKLAIPLWNELRQLNPKDPDVQQVFKQKVPSQ